jgi:hypothetical protein
MSEDAKLPSARQVLASDAAAAQARVAPAAARGVPSQDEDFRRVLMALRTVLHMSGT